MCKFGKKQTMGINDKGKQVRDKRKNGVRILD